MQNKAIDLNKNLFVLRSILIMLNQITLIFINYDSKDKNLYTFKKVKAKNTTNHF